MSACIPVGRRRWLGFWLATWLIVVTSPTANAQTAEQKGLTIAQEADRRVRGYGDYSARLTMVLHDRDGNERKRELKIRALEVEGGGEKTLVIFDSPPDLRGTALLTFSHPAKNDDQWLYLPALKRVKRIASSGQAGSFMGSEFAYEDVGSQVVEKFSYRYARDETVDQTQAFVVERIPLDPGSGYSRQLVWVDKAEYRPLRIDYYDRAGELLKTLRFKDYREYPGAGWRAGRLVMENHQAGRTTLLIWSDYEFGVGLSDRDFDPARLEQVR